MAESKDADPFTRSPQQQQGNSPIPTGKGTAQKSGRTRRRRPESTLTAPVGGGFTGSMGSPGSFGGYSTTYPVSPNTTHLIAGASQQSNLLAPDGGPLGPKRSGPGCFAYADGTIYEGEWQDGKQHGHGVCVYPSGNIYVGDWSHGIIEGRGAMLYADSDLFEGNWRNGACDGEGTFFSSGTETQGTWRKGYKTSGVTVLISENDASATLRYQTMSQLLRSVSSTLFANDNAAGRTRIGTSTPPHALPYDTPLHVSHKPNASPGEISLTSGGDRGENVLKHFPHGADLSASEGGGVKSRVNLHASIVIDPPPGGGGNLSASVRQTLGLEDPSDPIQSGKNLQATASGKTLNPDVLFSVAGPSYNTSFDIGQWFKYFGLFLFPYLSFPHCRCPLRVNVLDLEREYVVSGAALHLDFENPTTAIYCAALAVACAVLGFIGGTTLSYGVTDHTLVARIDIIGPIVIIFIFAAMQAGYHSFVRVAHALERVDRKTFPKLASFAASCVDSQASICIYTWGDDGNSKVTNKHYRYRWLMVSCGVALLTAWLSPMYRGARGESAFGHDAIEQLTVVVSMLAAFTGVNGVTFYVLKITDMERQVLGQMRVLSRAAYVSGVSLLRPTDHRKIKFNVDAPLHTAKLTEGFVGWYVTRCFVLYASTCANHASRVTAMSAFFLFVIMMAFVTVGDLFYAFTLDYDHTHYSVAHLMGLVFSVSWGFLLLRYMYVLVMVDRERTKHLYIADVTALVHSCQNSQERNLTGTATPRIVLPQTHPVEVQPEIYGSYANRLSASPEIVNLCKSMMVHHDYKPRMLGIHVSAVFLFVATFFIMAMIGVHAFWLIFALSSS